MKQLLFIAGFFFFTGLHALSQTNSDMPRDTLASGKPLLVVNDSIIVGYKKATAPNPCKFDSSARIVTLKYLKPQDATTRFKTLGAHGVQDLKLNKTGYVTRTLKELSDFFSLQGDITYKIDGMVIEDHKFVIAVGTIYKIEIASTDEKCLNPKHVLNIIAGSSL